MGLFHDKPSWQNPFYTLREEIANSVTHGIGVALSVVGLVTLIVLAMMYGDEWGVVSFTIFGASLLALYLASTLYHSTDPLNVSCANATMPPSTCSSPEPTRPFS